MQVIIPVAGRGERLLPITLDKPKAMIEVAGKPVLCHIIDNLLRCGLTNIVLVTKPTIHTPIRKAAKIPVAAKWPFCLLNHNLTIIQISGT